MFPSASAQVLRVMVGCSFAEYCVGTDGIRDQPALDKQTESEDQRKRRLCYGLSTARNVCRYIMLCPEMTKHVDFQLCRIVHSNSD
jgi:hypothetical protein